MSINALRARVESSLAGRIAAPFAYRDRRVADTVSCGIPEIDRLAGGLPRGGLTEIYGPPCSGRTSVLLAALAARTVHGETCALVDGRDTFDPAVAEAAGVRLRQLLWVRCRDIEQALHSTDLLLRGGGFGLIAVDLADIAPKTVRGVALHTWFRFRRAVEDTPSILLVLEQESNAKTCASLVLRMEGMETRWEPECCPEGRRYTSHVSAEANQPTNIPWINLLGGFGARAELVHVRVRPGGQTVFYGAPPSRAGSGSRDVEIFQTRTDWLAEAG